MAKKPQVVDNSSLFDDLLKETGNEYGAAIVDEGVSAGDVSYYIPTGSYSLNALLSGSIYGGLPGNKIYAYAGEPSTGKSFYALAAVKQFLQDNQDGFVFYFESESAISRDMVIARGIDIKRMAIIPVATVQEFRTQALRILNKYMESPENGRPKIMFVLDSLGNLSTTKEMEDIVEGKETRDMTRSQLVKAAFRVLTLKLGMAQVGMICTNHIYDVIGSYVPMKKMGGGCLVRGTKIKTPDGDIEIQNFKVGDFVKTLCGPQKVVETYEYTNKDVYEIKLDGAVIRCSTDHKFLIDGKWYSVTDMITLMETNTNIDVADIFGDTDAYCQAIYENLQFADVE